jgi:hypothetical protein
MSRSELNRTIVSIVTILISYFAVYWILTSPYHGSDLLSRAGWVSAGLCAMGVSVFFWAKLLVYTATKRHSSQRECVYAGLVTVIPGFLLLVANGIRLPQGSILLNEGVLTGMLLRHFVYPNAENAPFENDPPIALFPK